MIEGYLFQIQKEDNVATALDYISKGMEVGVRGEFLESVLTSKEDIPKGHKIAVCNILKGEKIIKYGVVIGEAICDIEKGNWVHLHCIKSVYDTRSSHLDVHTGLSTDISYE